MIMKLLYRWIRKKCTGVSDSKRGRHSCVWCDCFIPHCLINVAVIDCRLENSQTVKCPPGSQSNSGGDKYFLTNNAVICRRHYSIATTVSVTSRRRA